MDQNTRNTLRNVVTQCRRLLEESVAQVLQGQFGIYAAGKKDEVQIEPEARMSHLSDEDRAYRQDLLDHYEHIKALGYKAKDALAQLIREVAFTHLNRFCAYRMMESRGLIRESVSKGLKSQGFLFYLADHEEDERRFNTGQQDIAYRHFLNWLGGTLSEEIGVLFAPTDPANRLYPPQRVIDQVLGLLNDPELAGIWSEDEAIGWVYQYFTPKELRDQARKESQAPRNSYELAFRNQFFTPRYVVEFLTDNTLGRIWYEMRQGNTRLKDQCRYMVLRPTEVFLKDGEAEPKDAATATDDLSQEELLKLPVYVPFRVKKDPRELRILDPACGSGHFLLYCFDLLLTIYEEAYGDPDLGPALKRDYPTQEDLRRDVPRLLLAHNLHGIDIDPRASQIAALALWLRCQRAYQEMGVKQDRPKITRSNIVCAEPMPGEEMMLKEFVDQLEPKVLGQVVEVVFEKMKLAGEAGALLKVEEDIRQAVAEARKQWLAGPVSIQRSLFDNGKPAAVQQRFDFSGVNDDKFFEHAEAKVVEALRAYSERAQSGHKLQRQLFSEDAVRGFAFIDLCHRRFDVVVMNPPFGLASKPSKSLIERVYARSKTDVYAAFVERGLGLIDGGLLGAITSRSGFFLTSFHKWREEILLQHASPTVFADLGGNVLDTALVETAAYCLSPNRGGSNTAFLNLRKCDAKAEELKSLTLDLSGGTASSSAVATVDPQRFRDIPGSPFAYWVSQRVRGLFNALPRLESEGRKAQKGAYTNDDFRFLRTWWEIPPALTAKTRAETLSGKRWVMHAKGGAYSTYYSDWELVIDWEQDGEALKQFLSEYRGSRGWGYQWSAALNGYSFYFRPGVTWARRTQRGFNVRALPSGCIIGDKGPSLFIGNDDGNALLFFAGVMNSSCFRFLLGLQTSFGSFEVGVLEQTPIPHNRAGERERALVDCARASIRIKQRAAAEDETSHTFTIPSVVANNTGRSLTHIVEVCGERRKEDCVQLAAYQHDIDNCAFDLFGIEANDRLAIEASFSDLQVREDNPEEPSESSDELESTQSLATHLDDVASLVSYCMGVVFGRWDARLSLERSRRSCWPDPFAPMPVCSPAVLQGEDGLPVAAAPAEYPVHVVITGCLADDPDHPDDYVRRFREVLELLFEGSPETIEKEACGILGVKELRDYFRKPGKGGFWDDHISRYSKSRRKAPIYWLLQSSKKNYAIWLYYHRLDKDLLFKALVNYVEPKIRLEDDRLDSLRAQNGEGGTGKATKKLDKEIEKQEDFLSELRDFEEKLRRAAELHLVPDLNDGVVLNIAPLHELVPWKLAEKYWEELLEGKYEWSSIGKQLREKGLVK